MGEVKPSLDRPITAYPTQLAVTLVIFTSQAGAP